MGHIVLYKALKLVQNVQLNLTNTHPEMDILCWILIAFVIAATAKPFLSYIFHLLRKPKLINSSSKNFPKVVSNNSSPILPLGTFGWPLLGETMEFISCAYSDHPESFMDKRRRL